MKDAVNDAMLLSWLPLRNHWMMVTKTQCAFSFQVQEKVKHFSNRVKEIGLKEIIRKEGSETRRYSS